MVVFIVARKKTPKQKSKKQEKSEKQLAIEAKYKAERAKVLSKVRYAKKKGYSLPENFVPKIPKKIEDASIRNIMKYTSEYIYKHAVYISPEGTKKKGLVARAEQRSEAAKRGAETRKKHYEAINRMNQEVALISPEKIEEYIPVQKPASIRQQTISTLNDLIEDLDYTGYNWSDKLIPYKEKDAKTMKNAISEAIKKYGIDSVLKTIAENMSTINDIVQTVIFGSGNKYYTDARDLIVSKEVGRFIEIITQKPLTSSQSKYYTELGESTQAFIVPQ